MKREKCAFDKGNKCSALTAMECSRCAFRKTAKQLAEGRKKADARVRSLSEIERQYIFDKYYSSARRVI